MSSYVQRKNASAAEAFATHGADVLPVCVHSSVANQILLHGKTLTAALADVRRLLRVHLQVLRQVGTLAKALAAHLADESRSPVTVRRQVTLHRHLLSKAAHADGTHVRLFSGV